MGQLSLGRWWQQVGARDRGEMGRGAEAASSWGSVLQVSALLPSPERLLAPELSQPQVGQVLPCRNVAVPSPAPASFVPGLSWWSCVHRAERGSEHQLRAHCETLDFGAVLPANPERREAFGELWWLLSES